MKNVPRSKTGVYWFLIIGILFCQILAHTMIRTQTTQTILAISKAQGELAKAQSYTKELALERDRLASDGRITRIAREQLGLKINTLNQTIYLEKGSTNAQ